MNTSARIKQFIEVQGLTKSEFYAKTGLSNGFLDKVTNIGSDKIERILKTYPEINLYWLITGEGAMLNTQLNTHPGKDNKNRAVNASPTASPTASATAKMPLVITVDPAGRENVVYVGIKARAGYLSGHGDREYMAQLPAYRLPGADHGTYRIFEADGVSMAPTIKHGDKVIGRWVEELTDIRDNRVHIIVTRDGVLIKRVLNRLKERGKLYLKSDTVSHRLEFPTIELDPRDILEIWYAHMNISHDFREQGEIYTKVHDLEIDVLKIKELLKNKL